VDTFVKKKTQSLLSISRAIPKMAAETLLKEYRRDIKEISQAGTGNLIPQCRKATSTRPANAW